MMVDGRNMASGARPCGAVPRTDPVGLGRQPDVISAEPLTFAFLLRIVLSTFDLTGDPSGGR